MKKLHLILIPILTVLLIGFMSQTYAESYSVETSFKRQTDVNGIGNDQMQNINSAVTLIKEKKFTEANTALDKIIASIKSQMTEQNTSYFCFRSDEQYQKYISELAPNATSTPPIRVSWAFCKALYLKAFIASGQKQWDQALILLQEQRKYAPMATQNYFEEGYIYNQQRKPKLAIETYLKGIELGKKNNISDQEIAIALRGLGYAQIELGQFDEAQKTLQQSLKLDPNNKIAISELNYIKQVQKNKTH